MNSAILIFAAASALATPADYVFAPFADPVAATNFIQGIVMGSCGDYIRLRAEDPAYIDEAWQERVSLLEGHMPLAGRVNVVSNMAVKSLSWNAGAGRWADISGGQAYVRTNDVEFMDGTYSRGSSPLYARLAKSGGAWCLLTNVYWNVQHSNELSGALSAAKVQRNYALLALAGKMAKLGLSRQSRSGAGYTHSVYHSINWSQNSYYDDFDWTEYEDGPTETDSAYYGSYEYYLSTTARKNATVGDIRVNGETVYGLSPANTYLDSTESSYTGTARRVSFDLGIDSAVATTGGVTRITTAKLYVPLQFYYRYSRQKYDERGYTNTGTNFTEHMVWVVDGMLDFTGQHVVVWLDLDGASVAAALTAAIGVPSPVGLDPDDLDDPQMFVDEYDVHSSTSDSVSAGIELSVEGNAAAILTCTFKTSPP